MKKCISDVEHEMIDKQLRALVKKAKTSPKARRYLNKLMKSWSPKELTIMTLHYGIENKEMRHGLRDLANKLGITRKRVLMIEKKAKERLKSARKKG